MSFLLYALGACLLAAVAVVAVVAARVGWWVRDWRAEAERVYQSGMSDDIRENDPCRCGRCGQRHPTLAQAFACLDSHEEPEGAHSKGEWQRPDGRKVGP